MKNDDTNTTPGYLPGANNGTDMIPETQVGQEVITMVTCTEEDDPGNDDDYAINGVKLGEDESDESGIICCCMVPEPAIVPGEHDQDMYETQLQGWTHSVQQEATLTALGFTNTAERKRTQHERKGTQQMIELRDSMVKQMALEATAGYSTRSWMYSNLNGGVKKIQSWKDDGHAQFEMMKRLDVSAFFITETHGSDPQRQCEEKAIQHVMEAQVGGSWTAYLCSHKEKRQAGVGIVVRNDWNHRIWWGLDEDGKPLAYRDNDNKQGRYLIMESMDISDVDDYIVYYAPNSGTDQRTLKEQIRLAEKIAAAAAYWKRFKPERQLHIVGDFNFSSRHDQHLVNGSEADPTQMLNAKGCTQGMASARDSESRMNTELFNNAGMIDVEARRATMTGARERTTVRLDFKHLAALKTLRKSDWAGGHKVNARVDKVYTCSRMIQDDATYGDRNKLGMRFVCLEYLQFDPGHGDDVTAGSDHATMYAIQRRRQCSTREGMGWILSTCAPFLVRDAACHIAGVHDGVERDVTLMAAKKSITSLQAVLRHMDDKCAVRRRNAGITLPMARPYIDWDWDITLGYATKIQSQMRTEEERVDEWTRQTRSGADIEGVINNAIKSHDIITGRALVAVANGVLGGLINKERGRSRKGLTGEDIRSKLTGNVGMMESHIYTKGCDDGDGFIVICRQAMDEKISVKTQQQQLELREDATRRQYDLESRYHVARWMLRAMVLRHRSQGITAVENAMTEASMAIDAGRMQLAGRRLRWMQSIHKDMRLRRDGEVPRQRRLSVDEKWGHKWRLIMASTLSEATRRMVYSLTHSMTTVNKWMMEKVADRAGPSSKMWDAQETATRVFKTNMRTQNHCCTLQDIRRYAQSNKECTTNGKDREIARSYPEGCTMSEEDHEMMDVCQTLYSLGEEASGSRGLTSQQKWRNVLIRINTCLGKQWYGQWRLCAKAWHTDVNVTVTAIAETARRIRRHVVKYRGDKSVVIREDDDTLHVAGNGNLPSLDAMVTRCAMQYGCHVTMSRTHEFEGPLPEGYLTTITVMDPQPHRAWKRADVDDVIRVIRCLQHTRDERARHIGVCLRCGNRVLAPASGQFHVTDVKDDETVNDCVTKLLTLYGVTPQQLNPKRVGRTLIHEVGDTTWHTWDLRSHVTPSNENCTWTPIHQGAITAATKGVLDGLLDGGITKMWHWLRTHSVTDRWMYDPEWHCFGSGPNGGLGVSGGEPIGFMEGIHNIMDVVRKDDVDEEWGSIKEEEARRAQEAGLDNTGVVGGDCDGQLQSRRRLVEKRAQCVKMNMYPLLMWAWAGDTLNPSDRRCVKTMWDGGCSLVAMSLEMAERLIEQYDDVRMEWHEGRGARSAFGHVMKAKGIITFGLSLPNVASAYDDTDVALLDVKMKAYVYEGLSCDLILGTPIWQEWVQSINWRSTCRTPRASRLLMDTVSITQEDTMTLVDDEGVGCTVAISAQQEQRVNPRTMAVISHVVELDGASREDGGADNYYTVDVTLAGVDLKRYTSAMVLPLPHNTAEQPHEIDMTHAMTQDEYRSGIDVTHALVPLQHHESQLTTARIQLRWTGAGSMKLLPGTPVAYFELGTDTVGVGGGDMAPDEDTFTASDIISLQWNNESVEPSKNDELRASARSMLLMTQGAAGHDTDQLQHSLKTQVKGRFWEIRHRLHVREMMATWMKRGNMDVTKGAESVTLALSWVAYLIDAAPHFTEDILSDDRWPRALSNIMTQRGRQWKAARSGVERLFVLLKAARAGLRKGDRSDKVTVAKGDDGSMEVNIDETLPSSYDMAPWTTIPSEDPQLNKFNEDMWTRLVKGHASLRLQNGNEPSTLLSPNSENRQTLMRNIISQCRVHVQQDSERIQQEEQDEEFRGKWLHEAEEYAHVSTVMLTRTTIGEQALQAHQEEKTQLFDISSHGVINNVTHTPHQAQAAAKVEVKMQQRTEASKDSEHDITEQVKDSIKAQAAAKVEAKTQQRTEALKNWREAEIAHPENFQADEGDEDIEINNHPDMHGDATSEPGFGTGEEKLPNDKPESEVWWLQNLDEFPEFREQWESDRLTKRAKSYLKQVEWGTRGEMITPDDDTEEAQAKARRQEQNLVHMMVYHIGMECVEEFDIDPWRAPVIKGVTFDERFLTLITPEAVYDPPRPLPPAALDDAMAQVEQMIAKGQVYIGVSPFNANVVAVAKPLARGDVKPKIRICIDMRKLNSRTVALKYSFGSTFEALETAGGYDIYNTSDCHSGFHQIRVDPSIQHMLAFTIGPYSLLPTVMSQGGLNSAAAFIYALSRCVGRMRQGCCDLTKRNQEIKKREHAKKCGKAEGSEDNKTATTQPDAQTCDRHRKSFKEQVEDHDWQVWEERSLKKRVGEDGEFTLDLGHPCDGIPMHDTRHACLTQLYVDDALQPINMSSTGSQYQRLVGTLFCLKNLLKQMDEHGIRLKAQKTSVLVKRLEFLGWTVSQAGIQPGDKTKAIRKMPAPKSVSEVRTLCGSLNYFRKSIAGCSTIEGVLHQLCKKGVEFEWGPEQEQAFETLKDALCSDAILTAIPKDPDVEIVIITDVSQIGIGCVAAVVDPETGEEKPCCYESTTLTQQQRERSASEREMLGIRFAVSKWEDHLLFNRDFTLVSDHAALKTCIERRSQNTKLNKWSMALAHLRAKCQIRRGTEIPVPDMISRLNPYCDLVRDPTTGEPTTYQTMKVSEELPMVPESTDKGIVGLHQLKGPKTVSENSYMSQNKRRLCRALLRAAHNNLMTAQRELEATHETQRRRMAAIMEAWKEQPEDETDVPGLLNRNEEKALSTLGGMRELLKVGLGSNLQEAEATVAELDSQLEEDWEHRTYLTRKINEKTGELEWGIEVFEIEDKGTMHELLTELMPEENIPDPSERHNVEFMAGLETGEHDAGETMPERGGAIGGDVTRPQLQRTSTRQPVMCDIFTGSATVATAFKTYGWDVGTTCESGNEQRLCVKDALGQDAIRDFSHIKPSHMAGHFLAFASPPCQAFSKSGHRMGWQDERANYFVDVIFPLMEAKVPVILIENVPDVLSKSKQRSGECNSPYDEISKRLTDAGYVVGFKRMNAYDYGGAVSRDRVFVQAARAELLSYWRQHGGLLKLIQDAGLEKSVTVEGGLVWPLPKAHSSKSQALKTHLLPWDAVDPQYYLPIEKWGIWRYNPKDLNGMQQWCTRIGDGVVGPMHDPNIWISAAKGGPSITSFGNTRYVVDTTPDGMMGVRRLTPYECMQAHGMKVSTQIQPGDHWRYAIVGGAVVMQVAESLAMATKLYYNEEWMKDHVTHMAQNNPWYGMMSTQRPKEIPSIQGVVNKFQVEMDQNLSEAENVESFVTQARLKEEAEACLAVWKAELNARRFAKQYMQDTKYEGIPRGTVHTTSKIDTTRQRTRLHDITNLIPDDGSITTGQDYRVSTKDSMIVRHKLTVHGRNSPASIMQVKEFDPGQTRRELQRILNTRSKDNEGKSMQVIFVTNDRRCQKGGSPRRGSVQGQHENYASLNVAEDLHTILGGGDEALLTGDVDVWHALAEKQRADLDLRTIAEYCETGKVPRCPIRRGVLETKDKYVTKHGVVFRINENKKVPEDSWLQLCVPRELQARLVADFHNQMGHPSADTMYRMMLQRYHWDRMHYECKVYVKYCDACQIYKDPKPRMGQIGYTQLTTETGVPGYAVVMDVIGPYGATNQKTDRGNRAALVIQDEFTRFVRVYSTPKVDAEFVCGCLQQWAEYMGRPQHIKSDRASNLIAKGLQRWYKAAGITKTESSSLRPQSHGRVERVNLFIHSGLRATLAGNTRDWDLKIGGIADAWNKIPHVSLGHRSPFWLMFGRRAHNAFEQEYGFQPTDTGSTVFQWVNKALKKLQAEWKACAEAMVLYKVQVLQQQQRRWKESQPPQFKTGDRVKIFLATVPNEQGLARKLLGRWTAEYEIARPQGSHTYLVRKLHAGEGAVSVPVHVERIKRYYTDEGETVTPHTTMEGLNLQDDETPANPSITDELLGFRPAKSVTVNDVQQMQSSLKDRIPDEVSPGWDLPLTADQEHQEYTGSQHTTDTVLDEEIGDDASHKLTRRDGFDMAPWGDVEPVIDSTEYAGYKVSQSAPKLSTLANLLCIPVVRLMALNKDLFSKKLTASTKVPKHTVIRISEAAIYDKFESLSAKVKDHVNTYRECDMGDQHKQWEVLEITDKKTDKGVTWYKVRWNPKDLHDGENPYQWVRSNMLGNARDAIRRFKDAETRRAAGVMGGCTVQAVMTNAEGDVSKLLLHNPKTDTTAWGESHEIHTHESDIMSLLSQHDIKGAQHPVITWRRQAQTPDGVAPAIEAVTGRQITTASDGWARIGRHAYVPRLVNVMEGVCCADTLQDNGNNDNSDDDFYNELSSLPTPFKAVNKMEWEIPSRERQRNTDKPKKTIRLDRPYVRLYGPGHLSNRKQQRQTVRNAVAELTRLIARGDTCETLDLREVLPFMTITQTRGIINKTIELGVSCIIVGDAGMLRRGVENCLKDSQAHSRMQMWDKMVLAEDLDVAWEKTQESDTDSQKRIWDPLAARLREFFCLTGNEKVCGTELMNGEHTDSMDDKQATIVIECMLGMIQHDGTRVMSPSMTEMLQAMRYIDAYGVTPRNSVRDCERVETPRLRELRDPDCVERVINVRRLTRDPVTAMMALLTVLDTNMCIEIIYACGFDTPYAGSLLREVMSTLMKTKHKVWALHLGDASGLERGDWVYLMRCIGCTHLATIGTTTSKDDQYMRSRILQELNQNRKRMEWGRWDLTKHPDNAPIVTTCTGMWWDPSRSNRNKTWLKVSQWQGKQTCDEDQDKVEVQMLIWKFIKGANPHVLYPKGVSEYVQCTEEDPYGPVQRWMDGMIQEIGAQQLTWCLHPDELLRLSCSATYPTKIYCNVLLYNVTGEAAVQSWVGSTIWREIDNRVQRHEDLYHILSRRAQGAMRHNRWIESHGWTTREPIQLCSIMDEHGREMDAQITCMKTLRRGQIIGSVIHGAEQRGLHECLQADDQSLGQHCWILTSKTRPVTVCLNDSVVGSIQEARRDDTANCKLNAKGELVMTKDLNKGVALYRARHDNYRTLKELLGPRVPKGQVNVARDSVQALREWAHQQWPVSYGLRHWWDGWSKLKQLATENDLTTTSLCDLARHRQEQDQENDGMDLTNMRNLQHPIVAGDVYPIVSTMWDAMQRAGVALDVEICERQVMRGVLGGRDDDEIEEQAIIDKTLREMEVQNADQASEFLSLFEKRHGINKHVAYRDRRIGERWNQSLNILKDRVERSKEKNVDMIKNVMIRFSPTYENNGILYLILKTEQLQAGRSDPIKGADVRMEYMEGLEKKHLMGSVKDEKRKNDTVNMTVRVGKHDERPDISKVDVGAVWQGANFIRLRRAIKETYEAHPQRRGVKELRDVLMNNGNNEMSNSVVSLRLNEWLSRQTISPSQRQALVSTSKRRVSIIRGPPGTGKSTTIAELVGLHVSAYRNLKEPRAVLVLTPTNNTAQDNLRKVEGLQMALDAATNGREDSMRVSWVASRSYCARVRSNTKELTVGYQATHLRERDGSRNLGWDRLREWQGKIDNGKPLSIEEEKNYKMLHKQAVKEVIKRAEVIVGTTCQAGLSVLKEKRFGLIVIDEAGLVEEMSATAAVALGPDQMVLVGDEQQLKARQVTSEGRRMRIEPFFHRVLRDLKYAETLVEHWRMCRACIAPVNKQYYNNSLVVADSVEIARTTDVKAWNMFTDHTKPIDWIDVKGVEEKETGSGYSSLNKLEAKTCVEFVKWALERADGELIADDIAIITLYSAQVDCISAVLLESGLKDVTVGTVDKWQGGERKLVVVSTVRTSFPPRGEFINDDGRVCVTFSRCTHATVVIGHKAAMRTTNESWNGIITTIEEMGSSVKEEFLKKLTTADQTRVGSMGGDIEEVATSIPEVLWRDSTRRMKWWISVTTRLIKQETMAILQESIQPLMRGEEGMGEDDIDDAMRDVIRQRMERHKMRRREEKVKAQYIGTMLFLNGLQHEVRRWSREGAMTAMDAQRKDVFGEAMGPLQDDLMFKDEMKGLSTPTMDRVQKILALCLGGPPDQPESYNGFTTRFEVVQAVREMANKYRSVIWDAYVGGYTTKPDIIDARTARKTKHAVTRAEQGFKGKSAEILAMLEFLAAPQKYARIETVIGTAGDELGELASLMSDWYIELLMARAHKQCARLWRGRVALTGKNVERQDDASKPNLSDDSTGKSHENLTSNPIEDMPYDRWDIWLWTMCTREIKREKEDERWYDETVTTLTKKKKVAYPFYNKRHMVQRCVGDAWLRECERRGKDEGNFSKGNDISIEWITSIAHDKSKASGEAQRSWQGWQHSFVRWLLHIQRMQFKGGCIRIGKDCATIRVDMTDAVTRARRLNILAQDSLLQKQGGTFISHADGSRIGFIHPNRNAIEWNTDRHGRKVGENRQTGRAYEDQPRRNKPHGDPEDELDDIGNCEDTLQRQENVIRVLSDNDTRIQGTMEQDHNTSSIKDGDIPKTGRDALREQQEHMRGPNGMDEDDGALLTHGAAQQLRLSPEKTTVEMTILDDATGTLSEDTWESQAKEVHGKPACAEGDVTYITPVQVESSTLQTRTPEEPKSEQCEESHGGGVCDNHENYQVSAEGWQDHVTCGKTMDDHLTEQEEPTRAAGEHLRSPMSPVTKDQTAQDMDLELIKEGHGMIDMVQRDELEAQRNVAEGDTSSEANLDQLEIPTPVAVEQPLPAALPASPGQGGESEAVCDVGNGTRCDGHAIDGRMELSDVENNSKGDSHAYVSLTVGPQNEPTGCVGVADSPRKPEYDTSEDMVTSANDNMRAQILHQVADHSVQGSNHASNIQPTGTSETMQNSNLAGILEESGRVRCAVDNMGHAGRIDEDKAECDHGAPVVSSPTSKTKGAPEPTTTSASVNQECNGRRDDTDGLKCDKEDATKGITLQTEEINAMERSWDAHAVSAIDPENKPAKCLNLTGTLDRGEHDDADIMVTHKGELEEEWAMVEPDINQSASLSQPKAPTPMTTGPPSPAASAATPDHGGESEAVCDVDGGMECDTSTIREVTELMNSMCNVKEDPNAYASFTTKSQNEPTGLTHSVDPSRQQKHDDGRDPSTPVSDKDDAQTLHNTTNQGSQGSNQVQNTQPAETSRAIQTNVLGNIRDGGDNTKHVMDGMDSSDGIDEIETGSGDEVPVTSSPTPLTKRPPEPTIIPASVSQRCQGAEIGLDKAQCTEGDATDVTTVQINNMESMREGCHTDAVSATDPENAPAKCSNLLDIRDQGEYDGGNVVRMSMGDRQSVGTSQCETDSVSQGSNGAENPTPVEIQNMQQSGIRGIDDSMGGPTTNAMVDLNNEGHKDRDSTTTMCETPGLLQLEPAQEMTRPSNGLNQRKFEGAVVDSADKMANMKDATGKDGLGWQDTGLSPEMSSTADMVGSTPTSNPTLWTEIVTGHKAQTQQRAVSNEVTDSDDEELWEMDTCAQLDDIGLQGWVGKVKDQSRFGWITRIRRPNHLWVVQTVVIRFNGVTTHAYTERWLPGTSSANDTFAGPGRIRLDETEKEGVTDHYAWIWLEDNMTHKDERWIANGSEKAWGSLEGRHDILRPPAQRVIGRWIRHTPVRGGGVYRIQQIIQHTITAADKAQEWPMTRWIQRVTRDRGKEMTVQYETPKLRDQRLFQRSIEDLMVVPAESMEFLLQNGAYDLQKNRFEDGWPTRLGWWPIYHRRSSGKRVNYVKLDNAVVQKAMQVRTIEGLRLTKTRRSGKEYEASERTSDEEGGGVKGGSRAHIAK